MPRNLPAAVLAQMNAVNKRPVLLFEIGLSSTLRYAAYVSNIVFPTAGNTYTAKAIEISGVAQSLEGQIGRVTVKFDNVVRDMAAYAHNEHFKGKTLTIKRVYLDALGDATYYNEVFKGTMETPSGVSRHWLTVPSTSGIPLNKRALTFPYQKTCPWIFGNSECNTNGNSDLTALTATGTVDSGTTITLVDAALTQADDYWNHGAIKITHAGVVYNRKIKDFVATTDTLTLDVELPITMDNTTTYVLYKGCDKLWDTCSAVPIYGPSADNSLNFGGCIHIERAIYPEAPTPVPGPAPAPPMSRDDYEASQAAPLTGRDAYESQNNSSGGSDGPDGNSGTPGTPGSFGGGSVSL